MITIDSKEIQRVERLLEGFEYQAPTVIYRALNRAVSKARTEASKETRKDYNIKARDIRDTIDLKKAYKTHLESEMVSRGPHMPIDKFRYKPRNPRPKNPPVLQVAVKREGYKKLRGAFVTDINGNKIFQRVAKNRFPIKRVLAPAAPQMLDNNDIRDKIMSEAEKTYEKRLDHNIKRVLERYK